MKDLHVLLASLESRKDHLYELTNFIHSKTKNIIDNENEMILIGGDFNINSLKESEEN